MYTEIYFLLLLMLVIAGFVYHTSGGAGGARARREIAVPSPTVQSPPPRRSVEELEAFHADELNAIKIRVADLLPDLLQGVSLARLGQAMAHKLGVLDKGAAEDDYLLKAGGRFQREYIEEASQRALMAASFQRTLRDMSDVERATLRLADVLVATGHLEERQRLVIATPIVWNRGKSLVLFPPELKAADIRVELRSALDTLIEGHLGGAQAATERLQEILRQALARPNTMTPRERVVLERMLYTGARWMTPEVAGTALLSKDGPRPSVLRLGRIEGSEQELLYDLNQSLITVAPPGQGKSQSIMRNLLSMDGGAVVIDIKGEFFENTAHWRAKNVGPVYRFAPSDPANSIRFNPLDTVRDDVADAYEDALKLVNLMMVPVEQGKKDYWDKRGLDLLADAILDTALFPLDGNRTVSGVFDRLYLNTVPPPPNPDVDPGDLVSDLEMWLEHLASTGIRKLERTATAVRTMPFKVRESVIDTARTHINTWQSPRIEQLSMDTTFDPLSLRRDKATLYICVSMDELTMYTSFFRALIGQTFYALCRGDVPHDAPVVTFFLDEMPKLKRLDILETALDMGRGYGVRLWMFAQNYGQLAEHYPNPDGFLQNSHVRQFMGVSGRNALELSQQLSQRHGLIDGRLKPLVEPHDLTGDAFRDLTLTIAQGHPPARVVKAYGFKEHEALIRSVKGLDYSGGLLKL